MSKTNWGNALYKDVKNRGWVEKDGVLHLPNSPEALAVKPRRKRRITHKKTGWIDDTRNWNNRQDRLDPFMLLIERQFRIEVWPEFYFSTERLYRLDYALPVDGRGNDIKIGIEVQGGIWAKGNSGHSSGVGISRDMEKANLLQSLGWRLIQVTPSQLMTNYTLDLIRSMI